MTKNEEEYEKAFARVKEIKAECQDYFKTEQMRVRVTNALLARKIGIGVMTLHRGFVGESEDPHFSTLKLVNIFIEEYEKAKKVKARLREFLTF